jgi:hypothetical protein
MVAPAVVSVTVTVWIEVYVPAGTLKVGAAAGGRWMVYAAVAIALGSASLAKGVPGTVLPKT